MVAGADRNLGESRGIKVPDLEGRSISPFERQVRNAVIDEEREKRSSEDEAPWRWVRAQACVRDPSDPAIQSALTSGWHAQSTARS